jgi:hypothetical protein
MDGIILYYTRRCKPVADLHFDFVTNAAEGGEAERLRGGGGIVEGPVEASGRAGEVGAVRGRVVADCDDVIPGLTDEFIHVFGASGGEVYTDLLHDLDREGVYAVGLAAGARNVQGRAALPTQEGFRHLRATGVAGAENKNMDGFVHQPNLPVI